MNNKDIAKAMTIKLDDIFPNLPQMPIFEQGIRRAPKRKLTLNRSEIEIALKNALRYIPEKWHDQLAPEFLDELLTRGRIYGYRFRPRGRIFGKPVDDYKGKCLEGRAFQVMIDIIWILKLRFILMNLLLMGRQARYARTGCNIISLKNTWKILLRIKPLLWNQAILWDFSNHRRKRPGQLSPML